MTATCIYLLLLLPAAPLMREDFHSREVAVVWLAALGWWCAKRPATLPFAGFMALTLTGYAILKTSGLWS